MKKTLILGVIAGAIALGGCSMTKQVDEKDVAEPGSMSTTLAPKNLKKVIVAVRGQDIYGDFAKSAVEQYLGQMGYEVISGDADFQAEVDQVIANPNLARGQAPNLQHLGAQGIVMIKIQRVEKKDHANSWMYKIETSEVTAVMRFVNLIDAKNMWSATVDDRFSGSGGHAVKVATKQMMTTFPRRSD